jgi:hypothetical protein
LVLLIGITLRTVVLVGELLAEVKGRGAIGTTTWWADPTRDIRGLVHFTGQLGGTELKPWLAITVPDLLDKVNISKLSRVPHTAALVTFLAFVLTIRNRKSGLAMITWPIFALWIANFLLMIGIFQNPIRVPGDFHYRDVLVTLSMLGVGLSIHGTTMNAPREQIRLWLWLMSLSLMLTSSAVSISNPIFQFQSFGAPSPYALVKTLQDTDPWIETFWEAAGTTSGVVAVVDPVFTNRWSGEAWKDWRGLRGFYEFREAGFTTLEGSPKIRDASAFTGLTDSLKQSLDPPTADFCSAGLLSFLRVTTVVMSPENRDPCYVRATRERPDDVTLQASQPVPLADSGMLISNLSRQQVFLTDTDPTNNGQVRCGLLTDPGCFERLKLRPSSQWNITATECTLPCVLRIGRTTNTPNEQGMIVLPLNTGNALRIIDQTGTPIPTTRYNGLLAIPTNTTTNELTITTGNDWRMWLQVLTAYLQYAILIPPLLNVARNTTKRRNTTK